MYSVNDLAIGMERIVLLTDSEHAEVLVHLLQGYHGRHYFFFFLVGSLQCWEICWQIFQLQHLLNVLLLLY